MTEADLEIAWNEFEHEMRLIYTLKQSLIAQVRDGDSREKLAALKERLGLA